MGQTRKRPLLPILFIAAGVIVLIAAIFLFSTGNQPSTVDSAQQDNPFPQISRVDVETAKNALDSGQAVIVDVRDKVYYDDAHIAGAVSIPLSEMESRLGELDPDEWIILYCT